MDKKSAPHTHWTVAVGEDIHRPPWLNPIPHPSGRWIEDIFSYRVRIFHPALSYSGGHVSWLEISEALESRFHSGAEFAELVHESDINSTHPGLYDARPSRGQLPADVFAELMKHLEVPINGHLFGLAWAGFAQVRSQTPNSVTLLPGPSVPNGDSYCPCIGQLSSERYAIYDELPTPNFVWPRSQQWLVTTGYDDLSSTFATNDAALYRELLSIDSIEALPAPK